MYTLNIFFIIGFLCLTEGWDINIHYCRFRCSNSCQSPKDISKLIDIRNLIDRYFPRPPLQSNPNDDEKAHTGYYFRDFYGVIPPDAYPLGPSNQFPQTYIGLVYDPHNNGTYATTIYDGMDHVYNAVLNDTIKISEHIQILCTKSPESLYWFKLSNENYNTLTSQGYRVVRAAYHQGFPNNNRKYIPHYIVKTNKCQISYAGVVSTFSAEMEYALIDGTYASCDDYMWLMYKATASEAKTPEAMKSQASISLSLSGNVGSQISPVPASASSATAFPKKQQTKRSADFSSSSGKTGFSANQSIKLDKDISSKSPSTGFSANVHADHGIKPDKDISSKSPPTGFSANVHADHDIKPDKEISPKSPPTGLSANVHTDHDIKPDKDISPKSPPTGFSANVHADHDIKPDKDISSKSPPTGISANVHADHDIKPDKDISPKSPPTGFSANVHADHDIKPDKDISPQSPPTGFSANVHAYHNMELDKDLKIPKFLTSLTIGSCSITCTNKEKNKGDKIKNDVKFSSSMAYFWQTKGAIDKDEALPAGSDYYNDIAYIGQAPLYGLNLYDTGPSGLKSALIPYGGAMIDETSYFHVFSSNQPEKFIWVNTTTEDFSKLDENKLIPGGAFSNGTVSYVCRIIDGRNSYQYIGAARVLPTGTVCFSHFGGESEFQVLMYKQE